MIEINNFFLKSSRAAQHIRGGSGGSEFDTTFDNGWRKLIKEPARARVFLRAGSFENFLFLTLQSRQNDNKMKGKYNEIINNTCNRGTRI